MNLFFGWYWFLSYDAKVSTFYLISKKTTFFFIYLSFHTMFTRHMTV